jgi:hypothetical protein
MDNLWYAKYITVMTRNRYITQPLSSLLSYSYVLFLYDYFLYYRYINVGRYDGGILGGRMEDVGFRRADSLRDITNEDHLERASRGRRSCTRGSLSRSLMSISTVPTISSSAALMHAPSEEEGLSLLIHGSPIRDDETGTSDEHLLDYDSDADVATSNSSKNEQATAQDHVISATFQNTDVDMDQSAAGPSGQTSDATSSTSPQDAVYFQCRSARMAGYKDTLVSVSQDESFGKKLTVQSPTVGTFEDHENLANTFHGSRVTKGNTTINQSASMSFDPSKLNCFGCGNEHPVITKKPVVIMLVIKTLCRR